MAVCGGGKEIGGRSGIVIVPEKHFAVNKYGIPSLVGLKFDFLIVG